MEAPPWDLTLHGTGYEAYEPHNIFIVFVDETSGTAPLSGAVTGALDDWSITFQDALQPGKNYLVAWYADAFANETCSYPTLDPAWSADVTAAADGPVVLEIPAATTALDPAACGYFDLL